MDKNRNQSHAWKKLTHSLYRAVFSGRERSDFSKSVFQAKWIKYLKYFIVSAKYGRWHLHGDYIITLKTNHKVLRISTEWKHLHLIPTLISMALRTTERTHGIRSPERNAIGRIPFLWLKTQTWIKSSVGASVLSLSETPKTLWF